MTVKTKQIETYSILDFVIGAIFIAISIVTFAVFVIEPGTYIIISILLLIVGCYECSVYSCRDNINLFLYKINDKSNIIDTTFYVVDSNDRYILFVENIDDIKKYNHRSIIFKLQTLDKFAKTFENELFLSNDYYISNTTDIRKELLDEITESNEKLDDKDNINKLIKLRNKLIEKIVSNDYSDTDKEMLESLEYALTKLGVFYSIEFERLKFSDYSCKELTDIVKLINLR